MTAIADLLALQETDVALDKLLARLAEIEESLTESEELIEARAAVDEKAEVARGLRAQQKDIELGVDEIRDKAAQVEKKLYSGSVTNPKELRDLNDDLRSLKDQVRRREDELLTLLVQVEEAEGELQSAQSVLEEIEGAWKASQAEMLAERERIQPEVERLRGMRDSQATGVDRATMGLYALLRDRRAGYAVAKIERGMCQGCRITLPTSVLQRARTGVGVVQCVSCERILLLT